MTPIYTVSMTLTIYDEFAHDKQRELVIGPFMLIHEDAALEGWIRDKWQAQSAAELAALGPAGSGDMFG